MRNRDEPIQALLGRTAATSSTSGASPPSWISRLKRFASMGIEVLEMATAIRMSCPPNARKTP